MTRPRADATAYRIIAKPYSGILWRDQFWTDAEWRARERDRTKWRAYRTSRRDAERQGEQA